MIPIGFLEIGLRDLLEIVLIATILYYLYRWIRGTYAIQAVAAGQLQRWCQGCGTAPWLQVHRPNLFPLGNG